MFLTRRNGDHVDGPSPAATISPDRVAEGRDRILAELRKVIVGQDDVVEQVLIALFTGGHCLITGVPGLAKTLLIKTLADILDLNFKRIQFTPDLMPSDITGTEILDEEQGTRRLRFVKGPIFAQIILADELNRTPPKTQAALLEAMQEYRVTPGPGERARVRRQVGEVGRGTARVAGARARRESPRPDAWPLSRLDQGHSGAGQAHPAPSRHDELLCRV